MGTAAQPEATPPESPPAHGQSRIVLRIFAISAAETMPSPSQSPGHPATALVGVSVAVGAKVDVRVTVAPPGVIVLLGVGVAVGGLDVNVFVGVLVGPDGVNVNVGPPTMLPTHDPL